MNLQVLVELVAPFLLAAVVAISLLCVYSCRVIDGCPAEEFLCCEGDIVPLSFRAVVAVDLCMSVSLHSVPEQLSCTVEMHLWM